MKRLLNRFVMGTVVLGVIAVAAGLSARPALAAAKKKDAPKWDPYQLTALFLPSACTFNSVLYFCRVDLTPVPAGQLLTIEHVSLFVALNSGSPDSVRFLNSNGNAFWVQPTFTQRVNASHYFLDRDVLVYYAGGDVPHILLAVTTPLAAAEVTVHGKLTTAD